MQSDSIKVVALDIDGVLTDGTVAYTADGEEQKSISFRDVDAIFDARRHGLQVVLITGEDSPWVEFLSRRLEMDHTIRGAKDKLQAIHNLARRIQVPLTAVCYLGDSDRDAAALSAVGLGMAPSDATTRARAAANIVLMSKGGAGAVYEAISYLLDREHRPDVNQKVRDTADTSKGMDFPASIQRFQDIVAESIAVKQAAMEQLASTVVRAADTIAAAIKDGHKLLIFGNGGSAADAQHFAAEFVGRFERERHAFAAVALSTDTSVITALGNDYGMDAIFARQIEALARPGDIAIAISTSGTSMNVIKGVAAASRIPIGTIGMTGRKGGSLVSGVDLSIRVPADRTARVQEVHGLIIHIISELVESYLVELAFDNHGNMP